MLIVNNKNEFFSKDSYYYKSIDKFVDVDINFKSFEALLSN